MHLGLATLIIGLAVIAISFLAFLLGHNDNDD